MGMNIIKKYQNENEEKCQKLGILKVDKLLSKYIKLYTTSN